VILQKLLLLELTSLFVLLHWFPVFLRIKAEFPGHLQDIGDLHSPTPLASPLASLLPLAVVPAPPLPRVSPSLLSEGSANTDFSLLPHLCPVFHLSTYQP
jgi:hypothetical protein